MKTSITKTILSAVLAAMLFGCGSSSGEAEGAPMQKVALVIIEDQSGSAIQNESETAKEIQWIRRYLTDHREPQDIHLLLLNDASGSAVNCHTFQWKESPKQEDGYVSESDKMLKSQAQKSSDRSQFKKLESQLFKTLLEQNKNERSSETCIIEIMPQLDRIIREYGSVDILILSDGIQESKIRSFANPPATKKEAESMAGADSKKIRSLFAIDDKVLENVRSVTVLVPASSKRKNLTIIPYYYSAFFSDFGFHDAVRWQSLDF